MLEKREAPRNALLRGLELEDLQRICRFLQRAEILPAERLPERDPTLRGFWFPESGFISVLIRDRREVETEVAMVGREGAIDVQAPGPAEGRGFQFIAQQRGVAHFIASDHLETVLELAPALHGVLNAAAASLLDQVAGTAHANARGRVVERLARWLLMAHDRVGVDVLFMTHDLMAAMLGVRRVGVTNALHVLEGERLIRAHRGRVRILDREGLIRVAKDLYTPIEPHPVQPWALGRRNGGDHLATLDGAGQARGDGQDHTSDHAG